MRWGLIPSMGQGPFHQQPHDQSTLRLIQPFHDRMSVFILHPKEYELWIDRVVTAPEKLKTLYQHYPADLMEMYPVSPLVNTPRNDSPECIEPLHEQ